MQQDIGTLLQNRALFVSISASLVAQSLKLLIEYLRSRKINFRVLLETGGMPSSHSSFVTALATCVGQTKGWNSSEFAIATVFAIIVMYDATGVRRAAGKQARILNKIVDELFQEHPVFNEKRLKELLGHTPIQVIGGCFLGILLAALFGPAGVLT
jgi:uncharacterized protein